MFKTGTRVMVLSSSFSGKTGPKVGSMGYITGDSVSYLDNDSPFFIFPTEIVFTRYGFELKIRRECKRFIAIAPIGPLDMDEEDREKELDERLKRTYNIQNEKCDTLKMLKSSRMFRSTAIGLLAPAPKVNLMGSGPEERVAWLESHVRTEEILLIVEEMLSKFGKANNGFGNEFLNNVFLANRSLNARLDIISTSEKNNTISNFIAGFQRFLTVGLQDTRRVGLENLVEWFEQTVIDSFGKERQLLTTLMRRLFCHEFEALANIALPGLPKPLSSRVFFMKELRSKLVSLARVLEDTKNPKSITVHP